jgi:acetyl esterase/lipase
MNIVKDICTNSGKSFKIRKACWKRLNGGKITMNLNLIDRLDPELVEPVKMMLSQPMGINLENLPAIRASSQKMQALLKSQMPEIKGVLTEDRKIPGDRVKREVSVRIYTPEKKSGLLPGLIWIHGGGYILGSAEQDDPLVKQLSLQANCITVSVDYCLAPENPYPDPLEDCYSALKWLASQAEKIGVNPARIAVGGASAGGGLAAGLALLARDRAEVKISFQLLIYPMLDDRNTKNSGKQRDALFWDLSNNYTGWKAYLGCEPGSEKIECYASPARAEKLAGLPPAYITVGDLDLFALEDIDYAARLISAGVSCELHVYPGAPHAFDMMAPAADITRRFREDIFRALKRALHS